MKGKKIWFVILLVGIMTLTTVFYVTMVQNAKTSYANGRFVEQEERFNYEIGYHLLKAGAK